ncbi:WD40 repeat protein [Striga asiatica]|uniref:WD40 repeat protein n=1 Tax=Striga asiatica TaxID=4170 RepID=A0A5A7RFD7_STRAF|nr:WD40 repeat protein [Striga asiatica]
MKGSGGTTIIMDNNKIVVLDIRFPTLLLVFRSDVPAGHPTGSEPSPDTSNGTFQFFFVLMYIPKYWMNNVLVINNVPNTFFRHHKTESNRGATYDTRKKRLNIHTHKQWSTLYIVRLNFQ